MKLYKRENYLKKIRGFYHDADMIKVLTGVRRCGKSSLMQTIIEELKELGIPEGNLIRIDLDSRQYKDIKTPKQLEANRKLNENQIAASKKLGEDQIEAGRQFIEEQTAANKKVSDEQVAEVKALLENATSQLDSIKTDLSEKVHSENVKCYRNIQDLFNEFDSKIEKMDEMEKSVGAVKGYVKVLSWFSIINFVMLVAFILYSLGVFNF